MKRFFAALLVCVMLMSVALPMTAYAAENDGYVGSAEQKGDMDKNPSGNPKTGDNIIYVPIALATVSVIGGAVLFATADRKKKN